MGFFSLAIKKRYFILLIVTFMFACSNSNWRTASRDSAGLAVDPMHHKDAVIEFYAADAYGWKGWFAVHSWIAIKPQDATEYTVYEVIGWRVKRGMPALRVYQTSTPDRYWYGAKPEKFFSISGAQAVSLIPKVEEAIANYPWRDEYQVFPGPNSNTFPAWVGRQVPELVLEMPLRAIGSGYADSDEY